MTVKRKNRYVKFTENDLLHLSQMIISSFHNDELILIVIHGKQGFGKSTYASIIIAQVNGYIKGKQSDPNAKEFKYDWKAAREYFAFKPREFLILSRKQKVKAPCSCVDDAGLWLNSMDFNHPLVKATGKFLEVARTKWGAILFTCSDQQQIFTKIRNMPHVYTVRIGKYGGTNQQVDRRMARIFSGWASEDMKKSGRKTKAIDIFYADMPMDFYNWYKPERDALADQGLTDIEKILDEYHIS